MTSVALSQRLRSETKEAHTTAERSGVMRDLLRGTITIPAYVLLLQNLAALYEAMESEIDRNSTHAALNAVDWNAVRRFPALQNDIARLTHEVTPAGVAAPGAAIDPLVPATHRYVDRLRELGAHAPQLLFAHAYLRYLGDMYGGQIIKRIVLEKVISGDQAAVSFYNFDRIVNMHEFMVTFRESLDAIPMSADETDRMVGEAQRGYELHAQMFEELALR